MRFGFNDNWPTLEANLDWLEWMGADCARFPVSLPIQTWWLDAVYEEFDRRDWRPYMVLGGWNPAPGLDDYASWCADYAKQYPKATLCLWNEPNYHSDAAPNPLSVDHAIALNRAGREGARKLNDGIRVLYSPVGPHGDWETYFRQLYGSLPRGDVALHVYPGGRMEDRLDRLRMAYEMAARYGRVHVTEVDMAAPHLGDPSKPKLTARAYQVLERQGAPAAIFNSIEAHQVEAEELRKARLR
jgi:hypothetical protein